MTVPKAKQVDFIKWFKETSGPVLGGFGAIKHELYKVEDKEIVGHQLAEKDRFIERLYFNDNFDIPTYFESVKKDKDAWAISRMYESTFGAHDIELRILSQIA